MNLLPYNVVEDLVKMYSDDLLANHIDQDDTKNTYNKFWTNPSDSIKKEVNSDLGDILSETDTNGLESIFKRLLLSKEHIIRKQNINHYFGNWIKTVYFFYKFLNDASDNLMMFNIKTNDDKTHLFQIKKKPTTLQPGNCIFAMANDSGKYEIKMSYNNLIKKKMEKKQQITDTDYMQIFFLLCLEISRQLVDNALFFETPTAALMVIENKLIQNGKLVFEDTFYKKKDQKCGFKLFNTYPYTDADKPEEYRKQYEFSLLLALFEPDKRYFNLYKAQPNILYEHFQTPKQAKIMMKYSILGRLGHEIKNNIIKNNNSWILTEDLKELKNQFATSKLFYDMIKQMKAGKNNLIYSLNIYFVDRSRKEKISVIFSILP